VSCTLADERLDQSYVRHLLPRLARRARIEKRVHAHGLRHAYAVELEREGATISTIRDLLGHSSAGVTDRYLRRLGASEAVAFARDRSWTPVNRATSTHGARHGRGANSRRVRQPPVATRWRTRNGADGDDQQRPRSQLLCPHGRRG
jgi:Phage integrase family